MRISIVTDTFAPDLNGVAMTLEKFNRGLLERELEGTGQLSLKRPKYAAKPNISG